jgi:hypothetical protein
MNQRFNKYPFPIREKAATIWPKEHQFQVVSTSKQMATVCKHPRVRIVSRHEDAEFVECMECGEIFDSEEFNDMAIEEQVDPDADEDDS